MVNSLSSLIASSGSCSSDAVGSLSDLLSTLRLESPGECAVRLVESLKASITSSLIGVFYSLYVSSQSLLDQYGANPSLWVSLDEKRLVVKKWEVKRQEDEKEGSNLPLDTWDYKIERECDKIGFIRMTFFSVLRNLLWAELRSRLSKESWDKLNLVYNEKHLVDCK